MPKSETESAGATPQASANNNIDFANLVEVLRQTQFLDYLGAHGTMLFSGSCKAALSILSEARKKCSENSRRILLGEIVLGDLNLFNQIRTNSTHHFRHSSLLFADVVRSNEVLTKQIAIKRRLLLQDPIVLLAAVVQGNEDWAREILTSNPDLIRDKSATVTDLSGKKIKGLTPLQAAICAWDVDMVQMIKEVLQQKIADGVALRFDPELQILTQFAEIYPNGIDSVEAAQKARAREFKQAKLFEIFAKINTATDEQVRFELDNPGQHTDSQLNATLHTFREQFTESSNQEQIFNPFYLLKAFEFYDEQFDSFNGNGEKKWQRRELFCIQIIGFAQRYLPACFLQAFAQGLYDLVDNNKKLERNFAIKDDDGYMRAIEGDVNNLGYKYFEQAGGLLGAASALASRAPLSKIIANKKLRLRELTQPETQWQQLQSYLPTLGA